MCSDNFAPDCSQGEHVGYKHIPEKKTFIGVTILVYLQKFTIIELHVHIASHSYRYVVPENIHTTPTEGIRRMTSPPSRFSEITPPSLPPSPVEFPNFSHTPWKCCYLLLMGTDR